MQRVGMLASEKDRRHAAQAGVVAVLQDIDQHIAQLTKPACQEEKSDPETLLKK